MPRITYTQEWLSRLHSLHRLYGSYDRCTGVLRVFKLVQNRDAFASSQLYIAAYCCAFAFQAIGKSRNGVWVGIQRARVVCTARLFVFHRCSVPSVTESTVCSKLACIQGVNRIKMFRNKKMNEVRPAACCASHMHESIVPRQLQRVYVCRWQGNGAW